MHSENHGFSFSFAGCTPSPRWLDRLAGCLAGFAASRLPLRPSGRLARASAQAAGGAEEWENEGKAFPEADDLFDFLRPEIEDEQGTPTPTLKKFSKYF